VKEGGDFSPHFIRSAARETGESKREGEREKESWRKGEEREEGRRRGGCFPLAQARPGRDIQR
jgi:hypothetical protein